jgi:hypothetical protein
VYSVHSTARDAQDAGTVGDTQEKIVSCIQGIIRCQWPDVVIEGGHH